MTRSTALARAGSATRRMAMAGAVGATLSLSALWLDWQGKCAARADMAAHSVTIEALASALVGCLALLALPQGAAGRSVYAGFDRRAPALPRIRRAMVVGFDEAGRQHMQAQLAVAGIAASVATNHAAAIALAAQIACADGRLDLMLLDASLAGMSNRDFHARLAGFLDLDRLRTVLLHRDRVDSTLGAEGWPGLDTTLARLIQPQPGASTHSNIA